LGCDSSSQFYFLSLPKTSGTLATALIGGSTDHVISLQHQIPHPSFIRDALSYDQMVIKLAEPAVNDDGTSPTVLINLDDTVPESIPSDKRLEIAIIGFGQTATVQELIANPSASLSVSSTLQKTIVDHVPNEGCATHQKDDIDYGDLIKDDMICAWGNETGQCHGDSGGPYLLLGNDNDPAQDVQIGIVSWGVGCANQAFPSVASRTSATTFIRQATCEYSSQPPDYFECDQFDSPSPTMAPTSPTISPAPTVQLVPLNLTLHLDGSPEDTHWEIWDETETVLYAARSSGSYNASALVHTGWRVTETVWLHRGNNYTFVIYDVSKNGISRWGTVYEIDAPMNEKHDHKILLQGEGLFLEQAKNPFHVPSSEEEMGQAQVNSRLSSLPAAYATVYLDIQFDAWPSETGWAIVSASNRSSIFAMAPPGTYRDGINITETINLPYSSTDPKENEYALIVVDHYGDGILQGGSYRLWIPHQSNATTLISTPGELTLAEGLGKHLKQEALHNFTLPDVLASEVLN
jgi:trypsin